MFQLLKNTNIEFMRTSRPLLPISLGLMLVALVLIMVVGLNYGIEFTGGSELQIKYRDAPDLSQVRSHLSEAGLSGSSVTRIGEPEAHEVYIRIAGSLADEDAPDDTDPTSVVVRALRHGADPSHDLNVIDQAAVASLLSGSPDVTSDEAAAIAAGILDLRTELAIFHSVQELSGVPGMTPEALAFLESDATIGPFAVRSQSYIGPAIGRELKQKAGLAILGSLVGMLLYIWVRFQIQWGLAAVVALTHDTLLTMALFVLFGKEMSLPVVAAFLTLVGYSVNDTVVVFDRIRENTTRMIGSPFEAVINRSINQTLSRTVITSGLTLVVTVSLLIFGGAALNPFAFVLTVGVLVGTYSSIFVASPILIIWRQMFGDKKGEKVGSQAQQEFSGRGARRARKVRKVRTTTPAE